MRPDERLGERSPEPRRGADHNVMREVNRSLVLALVKEGGPVSRASIARSTTLAKPTVSAIVDELIADGLVRELGPGSTAVSGGRPPILLEFNARSQLVVGAHIGARRTTVAIGDAAGEEIARREFPTPTAIPTANQSASWSAHESAHHSANWSGHQSGHESGHQSGQESGRQTAHQIGGDELIADGLVRELGPGSTAVSGGRPPILLEFNARSQLVVGAHIGARRTTVAIGDAAGEEIARREFPTPTAIPTANQSANWSAHESAHHSANWSGHESGHESGHQSGHESGRQSGHQFGVDGRPGVPPVDALRMVAAEAKAAILSTALPTARLAAVGAVLPGLTDFHTGVCMLAPNLGWRDVPVRDILAAELGAPVYVHNAGQAAAVAENLEGAGGRVGDLALLYAGTGLSAGVLSDGRVFHGVGGTAGEIGHNAVPGNEEPCNCGKVGCLETVASGPAIVRAVRRALAAGATSSLAGLDTFDARDVTAAARAGDELAAAAIAEIGANLGLAASWLINAYNPAVVVVGGGLAPIGDLLLDPLRAAVARHALAPALRGVEIRASMLGPDAEVRGAVLLALQHSETYYRVVFRA